MAAPTSFAGRAYGADYGQVMSDILEYVPDLWFPQSVWAYSKMQNDPQLRGVLAAYTLPIRRADWRVDGAGCRPEVARLVADDLGLPLVGEDPKPSAARRRGVVWAEHLRLAVQGHLVYGFYPFEKRYNVDTSKPEGQQTRLVELAERVPVSITNIDVDTQGQITTVLQDYATTGGLTRNRLVWYVNEKEGTNWAGKSLLRSAYGAWLIKHELWRVHGTSIRRFGMGIPGVEAPAGATAVQIAEAQRMMSSMRAGETAGFAVPNGFKATLAGITGSVPDALAFIRYLDQQMSTMALAGILDLGSTDNGSRALGDVFVDLLQFAVQSVGDSVAATATSDVAVEIVDYNYGEDEPAPRIVCGDIGADREVTVEALKLLLDSGALSADPELEAHLRSKYHLPARSTDAPSPAPVGRPTPVAARRGDKVTAAAEAGMRRELTKLEAAAQTDFVKVQADWQTALDKLIKDWGGVTTAQIDELIDQIDVIVGSGDAADLAALEVDTAKGEKLLNAAMVAMAKDAADTMSDEGQAQGVVVAPGEPDAQRLAQVAAAFASLLGIGLAQAAGRKALQVWTPGSTSASVTDLVREHLESLTGAALRDNLGAGLSTAQNEGRIATLRGGPPAARYAASEVLDANSCEACVDIDEHVYGSLAEAEEAYANGGYVGCLGGLRCRGILVTLWDAAALEDAA